LLFPSCEPIGAGTTDIQNEVENCVAYSAGQNDNYFCYQCEQGYYPHVQVNEYFHLENNALINQNNLGGVGGGGDHYKSVCLRIPDRFVGCTYGVSQVGPGTSNLKYIAGGKWCTKCNYFEGWWSKGPVKNGQNGWRGATPQLCTNGTFTVGDVSEDEGSFKSIASLVSLMFLMINFYL